MQVILISKHRRLLAYCYLFVHRNDASFDTAQQTSKNHEDKIYYSFELLKYNDLTTRIAALVITDFNFYIIFYWKGTPEDFLLIIFSIIYLLVDAFNSMRKIQKHFMLIEFSFITTSCKMCLKSPKFYSKFPLIEGFS